MCGAESKARRQQHRRVEGRAEGRTGQPGHGDESELEVADRPMASIETETQTGWMAVRTGRTVWC